MKKQHGVFFGFAALLIAAIFTVSACGGGAGGGGGVPIKIQATNTGNQTATLSIRGARAVESIMPLAAVFDNSFSTYTTFYTTKLGAEKGSGITPRKFVLKASQIGLIAARWEGDVNLVDYEGFPQGQLFDFANNNIFVCAEEIPEGITCSAMSFRFELHEVEFKWPGGKTAYDSNHYAQYPHGTLAKSWADGDTLVTLDARGVDPYEVNQFFSLGGAVDKLMHIFYGGTGATRYTNDVYYADEVIPDFPHWEISATVTDDAGIADIIVPFDPFTVPSGASAIRIEIGWDLDGIIEQYEGANPSANDDIFVLKNGWWNGLRIDTFIE